MWKAKQGEGRSCRWITKDGRRIFVCPRTGREHREYRKDKEIPKEWETEHRKVVEETGGLESLRRYRGLGGATLIKMVAEASRGEEGTFEERLKKLAKDPRYKVVAKPKDVDWVTGEKAPFWLNDSEEIVKIVTDLDNMARKAKLLEDVVLWRGVSDRMGKMICGFGGRGSIFKSRTFTPTSFLKDVARCFLPSEAGKKGYLLRIIAPKGLSALYMGYDLYPEDRFNDEDATYTEEREVFFPRNASFRYLGRRGRVIELEYVGINVKK